MDKPVFEKGIPLPPEGGSQRSKYYWLAEMEVGDSFTCGQKDCANVRQAGYSKSLQLPQGFKLSYQKIDDGLYRVWRVA